MKITLKKDIKSPTGSFMYRAGDTLIIKAVNSMVNLYTIKCPNGVFCESVGKWFVDEIKNQR